MTTRVERQQDRFSDRRVATKTKDSIRTIEIGGALTAALREHRLATGRPSGHELVFRRQDGQPFHRNAITDLMRRARQRAGLEDIRHRGELIARAPTAHDLRHTHASRLIADGWSVADVAARLGDSIQTVTSTYAHQWDAVGRRDERRGRLEALYGSAVEAHASASPRPSGSEVAQLRAVSGRNRTSPPGGPTLRVGRSRGAGLVAEPLLELIELRAQLSRQLRAELGIVLVHLGQLLLPAVDVDRQQCLHRFVGHVEALEFDPAVEG